MSETTGHSRWRHFLLMLPFFLIGVAIPVYFFGFSGDGPAMQSMEGPPAIAPAPAPDGSYPSSPYQRSYRIEPSGVVGFARDTFQSVVDQHYVSANTPRWLIMVGFLAVVFLAGFIVVRVLLALSFGGILSFLIHKAAGPMFMGFMAVGSTWGIHQTIAQQFGMQWAATTVSLTAAIATLFALAGVKLRA